MPPRIVADPEVLAAYLYRLYRLTPPIDLTALQARAGRLIHIWQPPDLPAHGFSAPIAAGGKAWQLMLRADDPPAEQRFTFAHELWHIVTQDERVSNLLLGLDVTNSAADDAPFFVAASREHELLEAWETLTHDHAEEEQADRFAAALLMPRNWLLTVWPTYRQQTSHVTLLANRCGVSAKAMFRRLLEVGLLG